MSQISSSIQSVPTRSAPVSGGGFSPVCLGNWQLAQRIAIGQTADIFLARPADGPEMPCSYVIKLLREDDLDPELGVDLLRREALIARKVCHPHLVLSLIHI